MFSSSNPATSAASPSQQNVPRKRSFIKYMFVTIAAIASTVASICGIFGVTVFDSKSVIGPMPKLNLRGAMDALIAQEAEGTKPLIVSKNSNNDADSGIPFKARLRTTETTENPNIVNNTQPKSYTSLDPNINRPIPPRSEPIAASPPIPKIADNKEFFFNDSTLTATNVGDMIQFRYKKVRRGLSDQGVSPGDLFLEVRSNGLSSGTARLRSVRCGVLPYDVTGSFDESYTSAVFRGFTKRFDPNCNLAGDLSEMVIDLSSNK